MKKLILILLSLFLISCSTDDKDEYKNDQSFYKNNTLEDYELFNKSIRYSPREINLCLIFKSSKILFTEKTHLSHTMFLIKRLLFMFI